MQTRLEPTFPTLPFSNIQQKGEGKGREGTFPQFGHFIWAHSGRGRGDGCADMFLSYSSMFEIRSALLLFGWDIRHWSSLLLFGWEIRHFLITGEESYGGWGRGGGGLITSKKRGIQYLTLISEK